MAPHLLSNNMRVYEILLLAKFVCNHCTSEFKLSTYTNAIVMDNYTSIILPKTLCKKCGCQELTEVPIQDEELDEDFGG